MHCVVTVFGTCVNVDENAGEENNEEVVNKKEE